MFFNSQARRATAVALFAALPLALSACGEDQTAASPTPAVVQPSGTPSVAASSAPASTSASQAPTVKPTIIKDLSALTVDEKGKVPNVTGKWPLAIESTQVKVLKPGDGPAVVPNSMVDVNYHGVNARDGKVFDSSFQRGQSAQFSTDGVVAGFKKAIEGQKIGSRVLVMMTAADGYPDGKEPSILKGDNLIFVIDIISGVIPKPMGAKVAPAAGLPVVTEDSKGYPSVTIPKSDAPSKLVVQPLVQGAGRAVVATDAVMVHYRAWDWKTGKLVADDFSNASGESGQLSQLIPGWQEGLKGQKIGSRVMLIVPPALAYGDKAQGAIPANATLVYVIDLMYAAPVGAQG